MSRSAANRITIQQLRHRVQTALRSTERDPAGLRLMNPDHRVIAKFHLPTRSLTNPEPCAKFHEAPQRLFPLAPNRSEISRKPGWDHSNGARKAIQAAPRPRPFPYRV